MAQPVLIDTSAWIEAMRRHGDEVLRHRVQATLREGRARFCDLVRLELWAGIGGGAEQRWLTELEQTVETLPTTPQVWQEARRLASLARRNGLTLPPTDLIIAACARLHEAEILHRDHHFDRLGALLESHA